MIIFRPHLAVLLAAAFVATICMSDKIVTAAPLTPELAAKRTMVRKQQDQRLTHEKKQTAAEKLKADRRKVHDAKKMTGHNGSGGQHNSSGAANSNKKP